MDALSAVRPGTKVGRASRTFGQLWQVPTFLAGVVALGLVAATAPLRQDYSGRQFDDDCAHLRQLCTNKYERTDDGVALAQTVLERSALYPRKAGLAYFLAGAMYQRLAEESLPNLAKGNRAQAIALLEKARSLGVSEDDSPVLYFRLGQLLLENNTDLDRGLDYLVKSVDRIRDQASRGYALLVQGYLRLPTPKLDAALAANQKQLELGDDNGPELWQGRLLRSELLLRLGKRREALKELDHIPSAAPKTIRLPVCKLQARICQEEGLWSRAIPLLLELLKDDHERGAGKARILYQLGLCYHRSEYHEDQEARAAWKQAVELGGEEGQAAGLRLGDVYVTGEPANASKGLEELSRALLKVDKSGNYRNSLIPVAQARELFENAWKEFQERHDYLRAEAIADLYKKIAAPGMAEERLGRTAEARARDLVERAAAEGGPQARKALLEAREYYHKAGAAYELAADARSVDAQAPLLYRSGVCALPAQDYSRAIAVLQRFVELNNTDDALAEAYLILAGAFRAQGKKEPARNALYKCIEFPNSSFAYRARYELALDALENKDAAQAENILQQNLTVTGPRIDRQAQEQSLYKLAGLLFQRQKYDQAFVYLNQAVRQYPLNVGALAARDQLGVCARMLAKEMSTKLREAASGEGRTYFTRMLKTWLDEAAKTYQHLGDELQAQALAKVLAPAQQALLRKAKFEVADIYFEKGEPVEALRRYQILLENYRGQWDGIRACGKIWQCADIIKASPDKTGLAVAALRRAISVTMDDVNAMRDEDEAFHGPDRLSRQQWLTWLASVDRVLRAKPPSAVPAPNSSR